MPSYFSLQNRAFNLFVLLSYALVVASMVGYSQSTVYLKWLDHFVQFYLSLFLMWRFHPYIKTQHMTLTELDRKICFSAGFALLVNQGIQQLFTTFFLQNGYNVEGFSGKNEIKLNNNQQPTSTPTPATTTQHQ